METKKDLERQVLMAARDNGINSVLFRNAIGRKLGLNITDSECLSLLSIRGTSTPTELARHTGLTTGATTAMLDRLEKARFIRRMPNLEDRRGTVIQIDPHYTELAGPLVAGIQRAHNELLARYTEDELRIIADFMTRFAGNVAESTKRIEAGNLDN